MCLITTNLLISYAIMKTKKYFICSDIHGFYKEWIQSLKEAGFKKNDENHVLIVLGDIFDRGEEPWKIYKFLRAIPEDRLILIKGNHESLLIRLVERKSPNYCDFTNGTYGTLVSLYKDPNEVRNKWILENGKNYNDELIFIKDALKVFDRAKRKLYDNRKLNEIIEWIKSPQWRYFYEMGKYIFVHSFIPLEGLGSNPKHYYFSRWREEATKEMWDAATWVCPYKLYLAGCFDEEIKRGKVLVCGHWCTSDFYNTLLYKNNPDKQLDIRKSNPIFKSELYPGLIAIDACTVLTKVVNILIIDENDL